MDFFEKMKGSVSMTGQKVSQKAKVTTESLHLTSQIKANDKMVEKLIYQVGKQCTEAHLNEEATEYEELFAEIRRLKAENQNFQEELKRLASTNPCPNCGFSNDQGTRFCKNCGNPLPEAAAQENGKKCEDCGAMNDMDSMFCYNCGNKLQ